jgi:hypothetical protein
MRNYNAVPGYLSFPNAVRLLASITRPEETVTMPLFQELADLICRELRAGQLHAYLLVQQRVVSPSRWDNAPGHDDGKLFQVAERYWATPNANAAISGRWVEAPVLVPVLRDVKQEQNRGGFVMLEETSLRALIAGEAAEETIEAASPSASPPMIEVDHDIPLRERTSAAEWFRNEGRKAAEDRLRLNGIPLTEGSIHRAAADIWNALPRNIDREVTPEAFKKADQRAPKKTKGTLGTPTRDAGDTF